MLKVTFIGFHHEQILLNEMQQKKNYTHLQIIYQQSTKQKDKPSNHWKINAKQYLDMLQSHHDTIVDYAKNVMIPLVIEQQPNAFDSSNPTQFIHNVQKLLADTQKHILATDNHDLSPVTYGIDYNVVNQKPKKVKGLSEEQMSRMENEMNVLEQEYKLAEGTYSNDVLYLTLAKGYITKLLKNNSVVKYLSKHHAEILEQFQVITDLDTLDDEEELI